MKRTGLGLFLVACGSEPSGMDGGLDATLPDGGFDSTNDTSSNDSSMLEGSDDTGFDAPDSGVIVSPWAFTITNLGGTPIYGGVAVNNKGDVAATMMLNSGYYVVQALDAGGNSKWKKQLTGPFPYTVGIDGQSNVFVGGHQYNANDFGGGSVPAGGFLVKYDASGNFQWSLGGWNAWVWAIGIKSNGNVVIGGDLEGPTNFGGGMITPSPSDPYLVEYTGSKSFVRQKHWVGAGYVHPIVFDANDNAHLACTFEGSLSFGGSTFTGPNNGSGVFSYAVAKLDSSFNHIASTELKTANALYDCGIAVDGNGNVAVAGGFSGTIDLGGGMLSSQGATDVFAGELTANLTPKWGKRFGDSNVQAATGVAFDSNGNVVIAGGYAGTLDFGKGALPTMGSGAGMFLARFDSSGTALSNYATFPMNGAQCEPVPSPQSLAYLSQPDFVVLGGYTGTCTLPSGPIQNGGAFIARLSP